jgi:dTDP-4-dehydrorhamnose 3,5-epimerase
MLVQPRIAPTLGLSLEAFVPDTPKQARRPRSTSEAGPSLIDGIEITALVANADERGSLCELLTTRESAIEPIVHVYQVAAAPGSIRAWVFHRRQHDRLAHTNGDIEIVLYDLRPGSPTLHHLNVLRVGRDNPCLLRIPPFVVHGLRNRGTDWAYFINMPTNVYRSDTPDKCRLPYGDPRIPYTFE